MKGKIVILDENVAPSSPTPAHVKSFKLAMLDQLTESMLVPIVLYYLPHRTDYDHELFVARTTEQLKRSLSLILTRFYPLAGRVNADGHSIDCNDDGVRFIVSKFSGQRLSDLLANPGLDLPSHLIPGEFTWDAEMDPESGVLSIQVNYFDCCGIAIGAVFWHKVADGVSMVNFLKAWASANLGSKDGVCPNYIFGSLFPHKEELLKEPVSVDELLVTTGKWVARRYVFDASVISSLRTKSRSTIVENPTRVEAVSALLWQCFMAASLENGESESFVIQAVNLRRRTQPPFPPDCFGNFVGLAAAASSKNEVSGDYADLVRKLRDAVTKVDDDYVTRMQGDNGLLGYRENRESMFSEIPDDADLLSISSLCRSGVYSVDFGWGKPVWATLYCDTDSDSETSWYMDNVWLMDTRNEDGIEAWVVLGEKYMSAFDAAMKELRELACIERSPLDIARTN